MPNGPRSSQIYPYISYGRPRIMPYSEVATTGSVAAEKAARIAADTTLQNNINTEATTRAAADTTLQNNINLKANIASPTFTGDPKAPTPAPGDNDTSVATTAFVTAAVASVGSGLSGMVAGQLPVAATATTVTSSIPQSTFATPASVTAGDALRVLKAGDTMTGPLGIGIAPAFQFHVKNSVDAIQAIIAGPTKAVRFDTTATAAAIFGVDNTGTGSYQPLNIDGSSVRLRTFSATTVTVESGGVLVSSTLTAPAQRFAVIDPGIAAPGDLIAGFRNNHNTAGDKVQYVAGGATGADTTSILVQFYDGAVTAAQGGIVRNGAAAVAYITTSDERLKDRIEPTRVGVEALMGLQVHDFEFRAEPGRRMQGLVAQELYRVYPEAVFVGGDDPEMEPWGIDYGRTTPLLMRALQQQQEEIVALKARVAALEGIG